MKISMRVLCSTITLLFIISCTKDNEIQPGHPGKGNGTVAGVITDLSNTPVSNAIVAGGTDTTTTDAEGKFTLTRVEFNADTVVVNVSKSGFFEGSKNFAASNNAVKDAKIQLISKPASSSITASSGGNVAVTGGGAINFTSGFVNVSNGYEYAGNVDVSTFYVNATDQHFNASVPGDLRSASASNQPGTLESYGVVAVELNDASGNKLQLAQGKSATITLPIPAELQSDAPASIPLWYFDNAKGWWKREGSATRQGDDYVGTVNHFSFWSVGDISGSTITIRITVTKDTGFVYSNKLVTITRQDATSTSGYTDNAGTVTGSVPANEVLTVNVFNDCNESVQVKNIGPFASDANVELHVEIDDCISTDSTQYLTLTINGNAHYSWLSSRIKELYQAGSHTLIMGGNPQNVTDTTIEGLIFGGNASPGSYPIAILIGQGGNYYYQAGGMSYDPGYAYPITEITKFDDVGGYIEGTISGWIKTFPSTATADSFPLTGSYRVKRIQ